MKPMFSSVTPAFKFDCSFMANFQKTLLICEFYFWQVSLPPGYATVLKGRLLRPGDGWKASTFGPRKNTEKELQVVVVVVLNIYLPVTGQRQTLTTARSAHFSLHRLLCGWRNLHLLRSFLRSNVSVDFFKFLFAELAACSKPPSTGNHCKAPYYEVNFYFIATTLILLCTVEK